MDCYRKADVVLGGCDHGTDFSTIVRHDWVAVRSTSLFAVVGFARTKMHLALKVWVVCPSVCLSVCVSCRCLPQPERQRDSIVTPVTVPQILMERVDVVL